MKRFFIYTLLLFIVLNFYYCVSCSAEDNKSQALSTQKQQIQRERQQQRPILPPTMPSSPSGVSPTPSPHIAAPPIAPRPIATPTPGAQLHRTTIHNLPSAPAKRALPITNVSATPPQIPIMRYSLGRVLNIGSEEDGIPWIEVEDDVFAGTWRIQVDLKNTSIMKKKAPWSFKDIQKGDMVNVIFSQEEESFTANFINVLTDEDLKAMEGSLEAGSTAEEVEEDGGIDSE